MEDVSNKLKNIIMALTTPVIAVISIYYVFDLLKYILSGQAKVEKDILIWIVGFLVGTISSSIFYFYFGSSFGSAKKDEMVYKKDNGDVK